MEVEKKDNIINLKKTKSKLCKAKYQIEKPETSCKITGFLEKSDCDRSNYMDRRPVESPNDSIEVPILSNKLR